MPHRHALVAGATGLVGSRLLTRLLGYDRFDRVTALVRRPLAVQHEKLDARVVDFNRPLDLDGARVNDAFCALGTTIAAAGSREAFRRVDHDFIVALAQAAVRAGATRLSLVSSVGADPASRNFYLRTKGETERDVVACGFSRVDIFRPGLLIGPRAERRSGEALAQRVLPRVDWLLSGALSRYRSIDADTVARAMVAAAREHAPGRYVHEYREMDKLAAFASDVGAGFSRPGHGP